MLPKSKEGTRDDPCWINGSRIVDVRVVFRGVFTFCRGGECSQGLNNQDCENSILQIVNNQPAHIQYLSGEMLFCYLLHACSRSYYLSRSGTLGPSSIAAGSDLIMLKAGVMMFLHHVCFDMGIKKSISRLMEFLKCALSNHHD